MVKENNLLNQGIQVDSMRLVLDDGSQTVVTKQQALAMAKEAGLDLFLVSPNTTPPVARLLDYGHYRYEKEKKQKEARKKSGTNKGGILKELKLTPRIGVHDFNVRLKHGREFLGKGFKVKLTVFFKGREATHPELGVEMIKKFLDQVQDLGWVETPDVRPSVMGRMMTVLIIPGRKKQEETSVKIEEKETVNNA